MSFIHARQQMVNLLEHIGWPTTIAWIHPSRVKRFPRRVYLFSPGGDFKTEEEAQARFDAAIGRLPAVRMGAVGIVSNTTIVATYPIHELGDGEAMFIHEAAKIDAPAEAPETTVTSSRLRWWLIARARNGLRNR
jgi:hypothetical protein